MTATALRRNLILTATTLGAFGLAQSAVSADTVKSGDTLSALAKVHNTTVEKVAMENHIKDVNLIYVGQTLNFGEAQATEVKSATTYTVQSGDTLNKIGKKVNLPVDKLVSLNGIANPDIISVGQVLNLTGADKVVTPAPVQAPVQETQKPVETPVQDAPAPKAVDYTSTSYTVAQGDSFWKIAVANGTTVQSLLAVNGLTPNDTILVGQTLKIARGQVEQPIQAPVQHQAPVQAPVQQQAPVQETQKTVQAPVQRQAPAQQPVQRQAPVSGFNSYPAGQCTYYVKSVLSWVPNYLGNATDWLFTGASAGHTINQTATAGSVAIFRAGTAGADPTYGHVAVVDSVNANGTINISESNYAGLAYHTRTISTAGVWFMHQ